MPWGIAAGALIGGIAGLMGGENTNAANAAINQQNEQWQTQMSNTAVQRRSADMQAAGINPILAAGNPASQPSYSPIGMQNPFGSASQAAATGGNVGSAFKQAQLTNAQIDNTDADTRQKEFVTGTKMPAEVANLKAQYALTDAQAQNAAAALRGIVNASEASDWDYLQKWMNARISENDYKVLNATRDSMIRMKNNAALMSDYELAGAKNTSDVQSSNIGKGLAYLNAILGTASSAVGVATGMRNFSPRTSTSMTTGPNGQTFTSTEQR